MSNILYLVHRIPYPPDKGDKIRSYNLLRFLSKKHNVYLGAFIDSADDWRYEERVRNYCSKVFLRPMGGWRSKLSAVSSLMKRRSMSVGYYMDNTMMQWVDDMMEEKEIDAIIAFSSTMAQYLPELGWRSTSLIADFVDVDSDKWRQFAARTRWPKSMFFWYEAEALTRWEAGILGRVDALTLISNEEQRLMPSLSESDRDKIVVIPNGVDLEYFDPTLVFENPYPREKRIVVFTGAMDYYPNEDGVRWFVRCVWPLVRDRVPDVEFWIVGSNPTSNVLALSSQVGVRVTGRVADVRPYLSFACLAVAPLRLARGMQNKVLEALAMNLPVVAVPQALQGLAGTSSCSAIASVSSATSFAAAVQSQLDQEVCQAQRNGRRYVEKKYNWTSSLSRMDELIPQ